MRRNCNLELRLVPPPSPIHLRQQGNLSDNINMVGGDLKEKQNQQLTIFYDGKISVCDVTEHQAKTILKLASEETEDKCVTTPSSTTTSSPSSSSPLMPPPASNQGGLLMKRSLQRFLQKRKHRIQTTNCPYHH